MPATIARNRKLDKYIGYILIACLLPPTRLLGILLRRNHRQQVPPRQIVFIKLLGLGSLVIAAPAIQVIRKKYPATRLILITDANIAAGIAPFRLFDETWPVPTGKLSLTALTAIRLLVRCWKLKHCWIVDLEVYSKLTTVFSLLTLGINRFGFLLKPVRFRRYLNTHNINFDQSDCLENNYFRMADEITMTRNFPDIRVPLRTAEAGMSCIIINNTCSDLAPHRKLPWPVLAVVCRWIADNTPYRMAFTGTLQDRPVIQNFLQLYFKQNTDQQLVNLAGSMDFETYYRFLSQEGVLMLSIDSAPLHIAQKLGLPTLSVWGPTHPHHYFTTSHTQHVRHKQYYLAQSCSPCVHRHESLPCKGDNTCMKNMEAACIIALLQELLDYIRGSSFSEAYKIPAHGSYQRDK